MRILILIFLAILSCITIPARASQWPEITEINKNFSFEQENPVGIDIIISDKAGSPLYRLSCHDYNYNGNDKNYTYSGFIDCKLIEMIDMPAFVSLLIDNTKADRDWMFNRGRFLEAHVLGKCSTYPDWGSKRIFKLRGMEITLEVINPVIEMDIAQNTPVMKSFNFNVLIKNSPKNIRSIAAHSPVKEPIWFYMPQKSNCLKEGLSSEAQHP